MMKHSRSRRSPSGAARSPRGSALLIVLAFIVIMSVVLLAYMARTQLALKSTGSSSAIVETSLLAETAETAILSDLRDEMLSGSTNATMPTNGQPFGIVNTWSMVPGRVMKPAISLTNSDFFNLVKQSAAAEPFYPGNNPPATYVPKSAALLAATGKVRASSINSAAPSQNGRFVSAARWNKPVLLSGAGFTATNQLPDWIYITRSGAMTNALTNLGEHRRKDPANTNYVVGRYAYNIYDIGGLLDINVAGHPSANAVDASKKGSLAWADLTAIPGIANVPALIDWRNKASRSDYLSMVQGKLSSSQDPQPWGEAGGFQQAYNHNGASDNRFFTRQDLLKYVQTHGQTAITTNALPYLTTFSADLDQASVAPHPVRPKILRSAAQGGNDAFTYDNQINPNFLAVLDANREPVARKRFPLERLKYLKAAGPAAIEAEKYFGLRWNGFSSWMYQDPEGSGDRIKRLTEVVGREPNFFELLKAAIVVGSLGGQYQADDDLSAQRKLGGDFSSIDNHIIQIGANIIDQYDADSYPTFITFNTDKRFWGAENLPYLYRIRTSTYRLSPGRIDPAQIDPARLLDLRTTTGNAAVLMPFRNVALLQPSLWNPHAPATTGNSDIPTDFRITAQTSTPFSLYSCSAWWETGLDKNRVQAFPSVTGDPRDNGLPVSLLAEEDYLTFSTGPGDASFREPFTLKSPNYPVNSLAAASPGNTFQTIDASERNDTSQPAELSNQAIGFRIGYVWSGPFYELTTDPDVSRYFATMEIFNGNADFELQYRAPDGTWRTYDAMPDVPFPNHDMWIDSPDYVNSSDLRTMRYAVRLDPRSMRYGMRHGHNLQPYRNSQNGSNPVTGRRWPEGMTFRPNAADGHAGTSGGTANPNNVGWTYPAAITSRFWGYVSQNTSTSSVRYTDPDGVLRRAMGAVSGGNNGLPMVTNNMASRPVILNRPFRSVAELGYAFRDQPWKQIDFTFAESGDAALLDVFCLYEPPAEKSDSLVSGRVNLNTRRPEVLEALLRGVDKRTENPATGAALSASDAKKIAAALTAWTASKDSGKGPLRNRSDLVGRYDSALGGANATRFSGFSTDLTTLLAGTDRQIPLQRQSVMRALVDAGTARTWTFLIDLIVQEGRYPEMATDPAKFAVEGEQRYWIQIALDRYTGKVVSKLIEAVHE